MFKLFLIKALCGLMDMALVLQHIQLLIRVQNQQRANKKFLEQEKNFQIKKTILVINCIVCKKLKTLEAIET